VLEALLFAGATPSAKRRVVPMLCSRSLLVPGKTPEPIHPDLLGGPVRVRS
jgi:hypothetical protein